MTTTLDSPASTTLPPEVEQAVDERKQKQALANKAYSTAQKRLREAHPDEFDTLVREEYASAGLTYRKRANAEEREQAELEAKKAKAQAKLAKLLAEFPDLAVTPPSD